MKARFQVALIWSHFHKNASYSVVWLSINVLILHEWRMSLAGIWHVGCVCFTQGCVAPASVTLRRLGGVTGQMKISCSSSRRADGGFESHLSSPMYIVVTSRCCGSPVWTQRLLLQANRRRFLWPTSLVLTWPPTHRKNISLLQIHLPGPHRTANITQPLKDQQPEGLTAQVCFVCLFFCFLLEMSR